MTDDRPILFVHVMKTGGTTLLRHLREVLPPDGYWPDRELDLRFEGRRLIVRHHLSLRYLASLPAERRQRIRLYVGHLPFRAREILGPDVATTTILRDPVERTISLLRQTRRGAEGITDPIRDARLAEASLEELYERPWIFGPLLHNHQTKVFSLRASDDADSYLDEIHVDEGRLADAKAALAEVDVLGVTERYDDFLDDVEAAFGWVVARSARDNVTPPSDRQPVSNELRRRIKLDNAIDIELHQHALELVTRRRPTIL